LLNLALRLGIPIWGAPLVAPAVEPWRRQARRLHRGVRRAARKPPNERLVATGQEALDAAARHAPDIAVLDVEMPGMDGVTVAERITETQPGVRCVMLTRHARPGVLRRALAAGAKGFVPNSAPASLLADVIRRVFAGGRYVDSDVAAQALSDATCPLTERERDLLRRVGDTTTAAQLGAVLHLSPGTVRNYLSSAMTKLGARNRAEAARIARDYGWI
jgi:two-component system response regulator DesR